MLPVKAIAFFITVLWLPGIAAAEEVYKSKDAQGVVEYSDQASPGAQEVNIEPTVTHFEQVKPTESAPPAEGAPSTTTETVAPSGGVVVDVEGRSAAAVEEERRRAAAIAAERRREVVDPRGREGVREPGGVRRR